MKLLCNRRDGDQGSVGAGVVCLLQGVGAIVSRQQRGGWLAGRVGAVVVVLRWSWRDWLWHWRGEGRSGDVEVASALAGIVVVMWWVGLRQGEGG